MASVALHLVLGVVALATAFPLLWMVSVSVMPTGASNVLPPPIWPTSVTLSHYAELFTRLNMGRYLANSLFLSVSVTLLSLVINSMAGYAFAKLRFAGRDRLFRGLLAGLVIPAQVAMLPLFLLLKQLGAVNTYAAVVIPGMASIFGIFLIRQYALSVPDSLIEAARIDGAGEFGIYVRIIVPLIRPILVTLAIFTFMGVWNDFMWPLIVLTDSDLYTLPVALATFSREHVQDNELMMAGAVTTVLPVLIIFLALQRHYVQGIMLGGLKG